MKSVSRLLVVVVLVLGAGAAVGATPASAVQDVSVTPSTGLADGQSVTVSWSGLRAFSYQFLLCDGDLIQFQRCDLTGVNATGSSGSVDVTVRSTFTNFFNQQPIDCLAVTAHCNVAMFHFNQPSQTFFLRQVPISFANEVPRPAVVATPNQFLNDGDPITVTLDHWAGAASVQVDECRFDSTGCVPIATVLDPADGTSVSALAARFLAVGGVTRDCAFDATHCFVRATGTVGGTGFTALAPLFFGRGEDFSLTLSPDVQQPSPHDVTVSARGLATGFTYSARQCTRFGVCGVETPLSPTGAGTGSALITVVDEIDGVACQINGPCSVEVSGTDGLIVDRRSLPVSFPQNPIALSHRTGLVDGQRVRVEGVLGSPSANVVIRRCIATGTSDVCGTGNKTMAFTGGFFAKDIVVHDFVGFSRLRCRRYSCRYEVVADGVVRGAVPIAFVSPVVRVSVVASSATEGSVAHVVVRLARATNSTVQVDFQTRGLTASDGVLPIPDFAFQSGTVRIPAGATQVIVDIPINEDGIVEPAETFRVELSEPAGALMPAPTSFAVVTITDAPPV